MSTMAIICSTPTDPVSQYATRIVAAALASDEPITDAQAKRIWRQSRWAAFAAQIREAAAILAVMVLLSPPIFFAADWLRYA